MRKICFLFMTTLVMAALSSCASQSENAGQIDMVAEPTPTPALSSEERTAILLEQPGVKEAIAVGESQVVLRQGEEADSAEFVLYREEKEEVLASIDKNRNRIDISKCHIEPFDGEILGYEGFYLFERDANYPYSYVYYIGLREDNTAKILFVNNASYRREKKRFETYFDEVRDIDGDGIREVISNNAYVVDGGQDAVIYDCNSEGKILEGWLGDLLDCKYYSGRATDFSVWYHSKGRKVCITFYPFKGAKEQVTKKYKLNKKSLKKITMGKRYLFYKSDNLNDLNVYGSGETKNKRAHKAYIQALKENDYDKTPELCMAEPSYYAFYDIDGNGVDEFIVCGGYFAVCLFTYQDGKVVYLYHGKYGGSFRLYPEEGIIELPEGGHMDHYYGWFIRINGVKTKRVAEKDWIVHHINDMETKTTYKYKLSGKRVTKERYQKFVREIRGTKMVKRKELKWHNIEWETQTGGILCGRGQ